MARAAKYGLSLHDRLVGYLPRYGHFASKVPWLLNRRYQLPGAARLSQSLTGFSARSLPQAGRSEPRVPARAACRRAAGKSLGEFVLFADTFNRLFEREESRCRADRLGAAGPSREHVARPPGNGSRPLCCGRTFLSVGLIYEARQEAERVIAAPSPS